ncbi:MAG: Rossmann-like and DUF2520 domain-containing protein [Pyrinomonadaceae bacterium]
MPQRRAAKQTETKRAPRAKPPAATQKSARSKKTVAIVGSGRLGAALAVALEQSGYRISALVARQRRHALKASRLLNSRPVALGAAQLTEIPDSDVLIIATPDDQIAATAKRLALSAPRANASPTRRPVALHVSGALSSDALAPLRARGFATGSLHPLVSVSDAASNAKDFGGAFYCVEGDAVAARAARQLVRSLGGQAFTVAARDKALYHAAAVFAAGHVVALFDLATGLLALSGVNAGLARRVALHLARGTLSNLARERENADALTGPFARADAATVRRHADALSSLADNRDALAAYVALGRRSLALAPRADSGAAQEIRRLLDELDRRR